MTPGIVEDVRRRRPWTILLLVAGLGIVTLGSGFFGLTGVPRWSEVTRRSNPAILEEGYALLLLLSFAFAIYAARSSISLWRGEEQGRLRAITIFWIVTHVAAIEVFWSSASYVRTRPYRSDALAGLHMFVCMVRGALALVFLLFAIWAILYLRRTATLIEQEPAMRDGSRTTTAPNATATLRRRAESNATHQD